MVIEIGTFDVDSNKTEHPNQ